MLPMHAIQCVVVIDFLSIWEPERGHRIRGWDNSELAMGTPDKKEKRMAKGVRP